MRVLILFMVIISFANMALAKTPFSRDEKPVMTGGVQVQIDSEFGADFVDFDEKEYKQFQKDEEKRAKLNKKRTKLMEKKVKLELQKKKSIENQERCKIHLEKLQSVDAQERTIDLNL